MVKKLIEKINYNLFVVVTTCILIGVLVLGALHILNMLIAFFVIVVLVCIFSGILSIRDKIIERKREKEKCRAYMMLKNKTIEDIAKIAGLNSDEAESYAKLQNVTLFDLFKIAKRAEEE